MEELRDLLGEMRDAVFLVARDGRVLYSNRQALPGFLPSDAEQFDERMPEALRLPPSLPEKEPVTERISYLDDGQRPHSVRRRLMYCTCTSMPTN